MDNARVVAAIQEMAAGKSWSRRTEDWFVLIRRRGAGWEVDCGWVVEEGCDDDYMSYTYHPFRGGEPQPWTGQRTAASSAAEAVRVAARWLAALEARRVVTDGEAIGSVAP